MSSLSPDGALGGPGQQDLLGPPNYNFCQKSGPAAPPSAPPTHLTTQDCPTTLFAEAAKVTGQIEGALVRGLDSIVHARYGTLKGNARGSRPHEGACYVDICIARSTEMASVGLPF
jgi:hypothetical protein